MKYTLLITSLTLAIQLYAQPKSNEWDASVMTKICELSGQGVSNSNYLYSEAFLKIAEASGGIKDQGSGKYNTDKLDKDAVRQYLAGHFNQMSCGEGKHFLVKAFEANNRGLLTDLLELSKLYFNGTAYQYWHFDFTSIDVNYSDEEKVDFISYLKSRSDQKEKADEWLRLIEKQRVSTLKYVYETNSRDILIYMILNEAYNLNRSMEYSSGAKNTFLGYVQSMPNSDQKKEWLELLHTDPMRLKEGKKN